MTVQGQTRLPVLMRAGRASVTSEARLARWASLLGRPGPESMASRRMAHLGGLASVGALLLYLVWRLTSTLPPGGFHLSAALLLVAFESVPLLALIYRVVTYWDIDAVGPAPVTEAGPGHRSVVLIPTCDEPVEVVAPTIAAACALQPAHQTWVLDDGDRRWLQELAAHYGARYVSREQHRDAKAGNMNHALALLEAEVAAGAEPVDVIAVLDCDHVPLPTFLTDTLGWFDDPEIALVQAPKSYYNAGAFDDDGETGEQGVFFHVLMPSLNRDGAGPFWCGSTSLVRTSALVQAGGVAPDTVVEDLHTTLNLLRAGGKTVYHHQVLAVGLAPDTPARYLLQRRRWALGAMQVLVHEGLWAGGRGLSWRSYGEYLRATLGWLAGLGTLIGFAVPVLILLSGAEVSTASPVAFIGAFLAMVTVRLWGAKRLLRNHLHWRTAFALRILRIPLALSCLWWLVTRRPLAFEVVPKAGAGGRVRGRVPGVLGSLVGLMGSVLAYAVLGLSGLVPWRVDPASAVASGVWVVLAMAILILGLRRIRDSAYATSRRNAYRAPVHARVSLNGEHGELVDVSVGGAAVQVPAAAHIATAGSVTLRLPGAPELRLEIVRVRRAEGVDHVSLQVPARDWDTYRTLSLWLFHTPPGVIDGLPPNVPAMAAALPTGRSQRPLLVRQHG